MCLCKQVTISYREKYTIVPACASVTSNLRTIRNKVGIIKKNHMEKNAK